MSSFSGRILVCDVLQNSTWLSTVSTDGVVDLDRCLWTNRNRLPPSATSFLTTREKYVRVMLAVDASEHGLFGFTDDDGSHWSYDFNEATLDGSGTWCREELAANEDNYRWESDGQYHTEPEPETFEEDDDDNNSTEYLPDYHSQRPSWREGSSGLLWGVELEVNCSDNEDRTSLGSAFTRSTAIVERDGSLDDVTGAEIVFAPVAFDELIAPVFTAHLDTISNYTPKLRQPSGHGFHLNIDLKNFDGELHQLKFAHLLNEADDITERIANRSSNSYAAKSDSRLTYKKQLGKYRFCAFHDNRLEVRIFAASLHKQRFLMQCKFAKSAIDFTRVSGIAQLRSGDYLRWLQATTGAEYRNLRVYLGVGTAQDTALCRKNASSIFALNGFIQPRPSLAAPIVASQAESRD